MSKTMDSIEMRDDAVENEINDILESCVICGEKYDGYGNNAEPLKSGRCCDKCNDLVIKERIRLIKK